MKTTLKIAMLLFCAFSFAQTTITGTVVDDVSKQPIPSANVIILGTSEGTVTDFDGNFTLKTDLTPPFSIQVSSVWFTSQTTEITSNNP